MSNMQLYSHSHWRRTTLEFYFSTTKDADDFAYKRIDSSKDKSSRYCERTLNNVEFVNGLVQWTSTNQQRASRAYSINISSTINGID